MIPFGIVSAQKLVRVAPTFASSIVMDFLDEVYTVDGNPVSPFDLIDGLLETHLTANGLGNRENTDILKAKGALFDLMEYGIKNSLQVFIDWKMASGGSVETNLLSWKSMAPSGSSWLYLDSLADYGFNLYQWEDLIIDISPGIDTGYNTGFSATDTIQRGGIFLGMLQSGFPARRHYGVALNDAASASAYTEGVLPTETISDIHIGGYSGYLNTKLIITRLVVEQLAFDYSQLADFSDLTAYP